MMALDELMKEFMQPTEYSDCVNPRCTRMMPYGCIGTHCAKCGLPCSSMGHDCNVAIETAWRIERENG